ncbi:MAG: SUMF1/EgtB/PvdO family nonheme iron enzyme [Acidobacteria bacterium]|nr:SUMF1/EgtB/PvdO family nonheme iron enzyme [Acidobacteriota bacterium]
MYCPKCNFTTTDDSRFCPKCGYTIAVTGMVGSQAPTPAPHPHFDTVSAGSVPNAQSSATNRAAPLQTETLIGATIDGKYRVQYLIGRGGMGSVYRATRLLIGDAVAVKILHKEQVSDTQAVERFRREAQAAARLKHPNAVTLYDFGVSNDGLIYLVMEIVEGENLRTIIQQQGPLTPSASAEIITQVCAALDEAHQQHIVHRDLKPDNIVVSYVTNGLRVKVLDFGIAKMRDLASAAGNLTQVGAVMGTPHYMSPEQCMGEELDHRSDIYSVGIVLYEMLSGMVPFNSPASTAVVIQHVTQPPPPLRSLNPSIPTAIEAVVHHALQKKREDRPQSAGALAQEFKSSLSGSHQGLPQAALHTPPPPLTGTPADGIAPTMQFQTPAWASRLATPTTTPPPSPTPAGQRFTQGSLAMSAPPTSSNKSSRQMLFIIGAVVLVALAVGAALWWIKGNKTGAKEQKVTTAAPAEIVVPPGMAYVAGGEFAMGRDNGELQEGPQHKVTVKPFFIDLYEVTCEEYQKFLAATGHPAPPGWSNSRYPIGAARQPVAGVSWDDANAYAAWIGKRLPTEEEWEYAARGTDSRRYPWGDDWKDGAANINSSGIGHPTDVGLHAAGTSPSGAFDMIGNVWEWTASRYEAYPGGRLMDQKPGDLRVIRGGCYMSAKEQTTTTIRLGSPARLAGLYEAKVYEQTGFRCGKDAPSASTSP